MDSEELKTAEAPASTRAEVLKDKAKKSTARAEKNAKRQGELARASAMEGLQKLGRMIEVEIVGVEEITSEGRAAVCASAFTTEGESRTKVVIPFDMFYSRSLIDMSTVNLTTESGRQEYRRRQFQILAKTIGLKTPVCIIQTAEGETGTAAASRKDALSLLRRSNFIEDRKCKEGEIYTATVISVNPHGIGVTFAGVDASVPLATLTERYLMDVRTHYKVGDKVEFVMRDLKIEGEEVSFRFDTKSAELRRMQERHVLISAGTIARGVISRIYESNGKLNIYAYLPGWDFAAKIPYMDANSFGREPKAGDGVLLVVEGFRPSGYLVARIRSHNGNSAMFNSF